MFICEIWKIILPSLVFDNSIYQNVEGLQIFFNAAGVQ